MMRRSTFQEWQLLSFEFTVVAFKVGLPDLHVPPMCNPGTASPQPLLGATSSDQTPIKESRTQRDMSLTSRMRERERERKLSSTLLSSVCPLSCFSCWNDLSCGDFSMGTWQGTEELNGFLKLRNCVHWSLRNWMLPVNTWMLRKILPS